MKKKTLQFIISLCPLWTYKVSTTDNRSECSRPYLYGKYNLYSWLLVFWFVETIDQTTLDTIIPVEVTDLETPFLHFSKHSRWRWLVLPPSLACVSAEPSFSWDLVLLGHEIRRFLPFLAAPWSLRTKGRVYFFWLLGEGPSAFKLFTAKLDLGWPGEICSFSGSWLWYFLLYQSV